MRAVRAFLTGMASAYEVLPIEKTHKAHFITIAESRVINLNIDSNINKSWISVASNQKKSFDEICQKHHEKLISYEFSSTR